MTDEDRAAHDKLFKALIQDLAPEGDMELQLAQRIATDSWRLIGSARSKTTFSPSASIRRRPTLPRERPDRRRPHHRPRLHLESKQLQLLTLYEQRINRAIQKNLAQLQSLQATRKAQRETAMKEAAALLKLSEMKGLEYVPAKDGFVFSNTEIHTAIDRQQRLHALDNGFQQIQNPKIPHTGRLIAKWS